MRTNDEICNFENLPQAKFAEPIFVCWPAHVAGDFDRSSSDGRRSLDGSIVHHPFGRDIRTPGAACCVILRRTRSATQQLIELGQSVLPHMQSLRESDDHELRLRGNLIVKEVSRRTRADRSRRFADGETLVGEMRVPGWDCVINLTNDEDLTRNAWVGVLQHEWDFLQAIESSPRNAEQIIRQRMAQLNTTRNWNQNPLEVESILALMVSAVGRCDLMHDRLAIQIYGVLNQINTTTQQSPWSQQPFREIVGAFIKHSQGPTSSYQGLTLAMRHDLEQEGLEVAERVIRDGTGLPHVRQYAILAMARFGDKAHVSTLEELLTDTGVFFAGKVNGGKRQKIECQVRDLALASLIHLAGGDPRTIGFQHLRSNPAYVFLPHTVGFTSEDVRQTAMARYHGDLMFEEAIQDESSRPDVKPQDTGETAENGRLEDLFQEVFRNPFGT